MTSFIAKSLGTRLLTGQVRPVLPTVTVLYRLKHDFIAPDTEWDFSKKKYRPDRDRWEYYDKVVWPPHSQAHGEPKRGEIFYLRENVKHSHMKLWYACQFVRGKNVDEAITQLQYFARKAAVIMRECLLDAQHKAVEEQKVEYAGNMYVAEAFAYMNMNIKGVRRHGGGKYGKVMYRYSNILLRLEEGRPSADRMRHMASDDDQVRDYIQRLRDRRIEFGL
uniref:Large ribosomal subunit protein uL22m n=1 Tax=Romanomermis culicivorax TaxID=13658 RepID=A0A915KC50_ROMCU